MMSEKDTPEKDIADRLTELEQRFKEPRPERAMKDIMCYLLVQEIKRTSISGRYFGNPRVLEMLQQLKDPLYEHYFDGTWRDYKPADHK